MIRQNVKIIIILVSMCRIEGDIKLAFSVIRRKKAIVGRSYEAA